MRRRSFLSLVLTAPFVLRSGIVEAAAPVVTHGQFAKTNSGAQDFFWHWRRNDNFNIVLDVDRAATLDLRFSAALKLKNHMPRMSVAAVRACLRGPMTSNDWSGYADPFFAMPPEIPGCFWRENLLPDLVTAAGNTDRHKYGMASFSTLHAITEPGFYRVEIWTRARSSWNKGSLPYEEAPSYQLPVTETPPGPRGSADGNVSFDFEPYDAYSATQPQNHLTVELR